MIRFDQVSRYYQSGGKPALEDITVEFNRGDFVFLIGASGSGKSTLLRMILREGLPQRGKMTVAGQNLARMLERRVPEYRRSIGMVFQDFRLLPDKTVYENVAFAMRVIGAPRTQIRKQVLKILSRVSLEHLAKRYPHEISGGEQQRAAIARAIVNSPAILLADEPTGNLDPRAAEEVMKILRWINASGTTVIMATHDRAIVDRMARRVVQLHRGKLVRDQQNGSYDAPVGSYAWELLTKEQEESGLRAHDPAPLLTQAVPLVADSPAADADRAQTRSSDGSPAGTTSPDQPTTGSATEDQPGSNTSAPVDELPERDTESWAAAFHGEGEVSVESPPGDDPEPTEPALDPTLESSGPESGPLVIPREFRVTWPEDVPDEDPLEVSLPAGVDAADMPELEDDSFEEDTPQADSEEPETDALTPVPSKPTVSADEQPGAVRAETSQERLARLWPAAAPITHQPRDHSRLAWLSQSDDPQAPGEPRAAEASPDHAPAPLPKPRASASEASYSETRRTAEQLKASKRGFFGRRGQR